MPFFTEEIYQMYNEGSIVVSSWPTVNPNYDFSEASKIEVLFEIITAVRNIRVSKNVANSKQIDLILQAKEQDIINVLEKSKNILQRFTNFNTLNIASGEVEKEEKYG